MQLFIGWSKEPSRQIAEALKRHIEQVNPFVVAFVSTQDIDLGLKWDNTLSDFLKKSHFGILCMTEENLTSPWLCYEAGLLEMASGLNHPDGKPHIAPVLFNVNSTEKLASPLRSYQSAPFSSVSMWNLTKGMNRACMALYGRVLQENVAAEDLEQAFMGKAALEENFHREFPKLEAEIDGILAAKPANTPASGVQSSAPAGSPAVPSASAPSSRKADKTGPQITEFARTLEEIYSRFGVFPDVQRVYFEGRQLLELFADPDARLTEKAGDLRRFLLILDNTAASLQETGTTPNRLERSRSLRDLRDLAEKLDT